MLDLPHAADVLAGASYVLHTIRPRAILFELNEPGVDPRHSEVIRHLRNTGYGFFAVPRCYLRIRLDRFDPATDGATAANDFLAVRLDEYETVARRVRAA